MATRESWVRERAADGRIVVRVSVDALGGGKRQRAFAAPEPAVSGAAAYGTMDAVVQALRHRISTHAIAPGAKLLENELAREFDVSRARIRDALVALEMRGLVERIPNRGAVVSRADLTQVFEIYDVREVLEGLTVRLAVKNTTPDTWADLLRRFGAISEEQLRKGEIEELQAAYGEMRDRVIDAANNTVLRGMLDSIFEKTQVIMRRVMILPGRPEKALGEHRSVLEAMCRGDAEEAERLKRLNIRSAIEDLRRYQRFVL